MVVRTPRRHHNGSRLIHATIYFQINFQKGCSVFCIYLVTVYVDVYGCIFFLKINEKIYGFIYIDIKYIRREVNGKQEKLTIISNYPKLKTTITRHD